VTYKPTGGVNTTHTINASYSANDNIHLNSSSTTGFGIAVKPRLGEVAYIGQTLFVSSGSSSTTAQVTLTASVTDPDRTGASVQGATVTFTDLLSGKVLASGVKVSLVSGSDTSTGTANTVVTLSTGQYGAQEYLIEVTLNGIYTNHQQLPPEAAPGTPPYESAHPQVVVMIPPTANSMQGGGTIPVLSTAAGTYGDATNVTYSVGMKYNKGGTNPQGQIQLIIQRGDGTYYIKSNSISSMAFSTPVGSQPPKDVTIYTKASIYRVNNNGSLTSIDGNVTLRMDAHEGCTTNPDCDPSSDDSIGFTVLSTKTSSLYYSNNWVYDTATRAYRTVLESLSPPNGGAAVAIN